jgi:YVTN family beta-propeller protein
MTVTDDELIERVRSTLREWADEAPVSHREVSMIESTRAAAAWRRYRVRLATAAAIVALAAAGAFVWASHDNAELLVEVGSAPTSVIEIPIGRRHGVKGITVTDGAVWVASSFDEELYRIDPATNEVVATYAIPSHVEGVTAAGGWLWLSRYEPDEVVRVDPATGALTARLVFGSQPALVADGNTLWAIADRDGEGRAERIDPATATVTAEIALDHPAGFAVVSGSSLWVAHRGTSLVSRVDLDQRRVVDVVDVGGEPRAVVTSKGAVWVGVNGAGIETAGWVARIDPATARVTTTIATGRGIHSLASTGSALWVTNQRDGTVSVIDTDRSELVATAPIGDTPGGLAVGHDSVWLVPHRDVVVLRIDPAVALEAAAQPDIARAVDVSSGTIYVRCSGAGSPTVVLEADQSYGAASWALVEARLSRHTRVCTSDRVGIADRDQAGQAGPAATAAGDLHAALAEIGEHGPFVMVGRGVGGLTAQMFSALYDEQVVGLVLVNAWSADFNDRILPLLPADVRDKYEQSLIDDPELRFVDESSAQVAAIGGFGDLPLVVIADLPGDPITASENSDPPLTVAEIERVDALRQTTQREQATLSTAGRFVNSVDLRDTPQVVVDEVRALLG